MILFSNMRFIVMFEAVILVFKGAGVLKYNVISPAYKQNYISINNLFPLLISQTNCYS